MDKYYGFYFCGEDILERELSQTHLLVSQISLEDIIPVILSYSHCLKFNVLFGFVKELTLADGRIIMNSPSKMNKDKLQAFILRRKNNEVKGGLNNFFINGKKLNFEFIKYDVTIIDDDRD